jgi:hypothetical protein
MLIEQITYMNWEGRGYIQHGARRQAHDLNKLGDMHARYQKKGTDSAEQTLQKALAKAYL